MSEKNFVSFGDSETIFAEVVSELNKRAKIFRGTIEEWNALTTDQKKDYDKASIPNSIDGNMFFPSDHVTFDKTGSGLLSDNVEDAIKELETNFQDGVDAVYDAVVAKGSTPASKSLSDVVQGIENIETGITPTGTINITSNGTKDVTNYASANVNVPNSNSGTYTASSRGASLDMGAANTYRYVNTNSVPNSNSATYTTTTRENKDLGAANTYRYVNTSGMPNVNSTTYTAATRSTKIDLGAANTYRYLVTSGVPNSNSTTYTYGSESTGGKVDLGATNTYRYVNAANVYAKGKKDLSITKQYYVYAEINNDWMAQFFFQVKVANGAVSVTLRSTDYVVMSVNAAAHSSGWYTQYKSNAAVYKIGETSY